MACFLCCRVFTNVCKTKTEVQVVLFKCKNINQSVVTMSLTEVQQFWVSKVVLIKKVFSEVKCTVSIVVKSFRSCGNSSTFWVFCQSQLDEKINSSLSSSSC